MQSAQYFRSIYCRRSRSATRKWQQMLLDARSIYVRTGLYVQQVLAAHISDFFTMETNSSEFMTTEPLIQTQSIKWHTSTYTHGFILTLVLPRAVAETFQHYPADFYRHWTFSAYLIHRLPVEFLVSPVTFPHRCHRVRHLLLVV